MLTREELRRAGTGIYDDWTALWNGGTELAGQIMAPLFTLRYAQANTEPFDEIRTPPQLADVIAAWRDKRGDLRFTAEGTPVVDLELLDGTLNGLVARPYLAVFTGDDGGEVARSGTDTLRVEGGLITEVWSVSSGAAGRTFYR
ncbi:hypothetical protein Afil01_66980 [Actinorhabdospora filicis]|uniref:SnoaL-like domain-containing protein n=2 Tax=Actinorhabdospora filicis TaxID=1785913 RepID=A0A9W6WDS0_9ACTN|nr:hypothetical protein Afil01_66980 [Actinorhabdospora filicis]